MLPVVLLAVLYYAYNYQGFLGRWTQSILDPLLEFGYYILNFVFGV